MARSGSVRRLMMALLGASVIVVAAPMPGPVHAQVPQTTAPTDAQRARARTLYGQGQQHFEAGRFAEALTAFEGAYGEVPNPVVLLGVASAHERLGDNLEAARTLRRYLRERADAPDRASIEQRLAQLDPNNATVETAPGTIRVSCTPEGAAIAVDGTDTGRVAPSEIQLPAGTHEITLTLEGFAPITRQVTVAEGATTELALTLAAQDTAPSSEDDVFGSGGAGAETTEEPAPVEAPAPLDPGPSVGVWVTAAVAGVSLVTGTVFGFLALSAQSDYDNVPTADTRDRGETFALVADLAFGVAIASGITAIVLYATERPAAVTETDAPEPETDDGEETTTTTTTTTTSRREDAPRLTFAPFGGPTGGGAALHVTF